MKRTESKERRGRSPFRTNLALAVMLAALAAFIMPFTAAFATTIGTTVPVFDILKGSVRVYYDGGNVYAVGVQIPYTGISPAPKKVAVPGGEISIMQTIPNTPSTYTIDVEAAVTVNLTDVNIDVSAKDGACAFLASGENYPVTVNLIGTNTLKSGKGCAGLQTNGTANNAVLTIKGDGSLEATGGEGDAGGAGGAGIGGGGGKNANNITIEDEVRITATGNGGGAGIGGGFRGAASNIAIKGTAYVKATGEFGGAGIGGGNCGDANNITIEGSCLVDAQGGYGGAGPDGGNNNGGGAGIGGGNSGEANYITLRGTANIMAFGQGGGAGIGGGFGKGANNIKIEGSCTVEETNGHSGGAGIGGGEGGSANYITIAGECKIENASGNNGGAGIGGGEGGSGSNIEILSTGDVTANGSYGGAGIGGGDGGDGSGIIISNGTVVAIGGTTSEERGGAGIGGGAGGLGTNIEISGGNVTATGGINGAGIGGGCEGDGSDIRILGGVATGTGSTNNSGGAGIGGGYKGAGSDIEISGGTVTGNGFRGAGIGGGDGGKGSDIKILNGTVTGKCLNGAGIGGGNGGDGTNIKILGGDVAIYVGNGSDVSAAGIGGGSGGDGTNIEISGGGIYIQFMNNSTNGGAGIGGGGASGNGENIKISGGYVEIIGREALPCIGGGTNGKGVNIEILGGTLKSVNRFNSDVKITGGSVDVPAGDSAVFTNGSGAAVYPVTATLQTYDYGNGNLSTNPYKVPVTAISGLPNYGLKDVKTDSVGILYLWLPSGASIAGATATLKTGEAEFTHHSPPTYTYLQPAPYAVTAGANAIRLTRYISEGGSADSLAAPVISVSEDGRTVTLECATQGAGIYYRIGDTTRAYTSAITLTENCDLYVWSRLVIDETDPFIKYAEDYPLSVTVKPKLAAATGLKWNNVYALWDAVANAKDYLVQLYKDGATDRHIVGEPIYATRVTDSQGQTAQTYVNIETVLKQNGPGKYYYKVMAYPELEQTWNDAYLASDWSEISGALTYTQTPLPAPETPAWTGATAKWSAVAGANDYYVQLYKDGTGEANKVGEAVYSDADSTSGASLKALASRDMKDLITESGAGDYYFRSMAKVTGRFSSTAFNPSAPTSGTPTDDLNHIVDGAWSDFSQARGFDASAKIKLNAPGGLKWSGEFTLWDAVAFAKDYAVQLYKDGTSEDHRVGEPVRAARVTDSQTQIQSAHTYANIAAIVKATGSGEYYYKVMAYPNLNLVGNDEYAPSDWSEISGALSYTQTPLSAPETPSWTGTTAKWSAVAGANDYYVQLYKGGTGEANKVGEAVYSDADSTSGGSLRALTSRDMKDLITESGAGDYYFRSMAKVTGRFSAAAFNPSAPTSGSPTDDLNHTVDGAWSDFSEAHAFDAANIKLNAPGGLKWSGEFTLWDAVANASDYAVQLYKNGMNEDNRVGEPVLAGRVTDSPTQIQSARTYANIAAIVKQNGSGSYYYRVMAYPNTNTVGDVAYAPSDWSVFSGPLFYTQEFLPSPEDIAWNGLTASWSAVASAKDYTVQLYKNGFLEESRVSEEVYSDLDNAGGMTPIALTSRDMQDLVLASGVGNYYFRVIAKVDSRFNTVLPSDRSPTDGATSDELVHTLDSILSVISGKYEYKTSTITFMPNGGDGDMSPESATENVPYALPACGFTAPEGKRFKEWAIGTYYGVRVGAGAEHTFTGDTEVYAIWEDATYLVDLEPGAHGKEEKQSLTKTHGVDIALPGAIFTREGYAQTGWATTDGGGKAYEPDGNYAFDASVTLFPTWTTHKVGDVNMDGVIDKSDAQALIDYISTGGEITDNQKFIADVFTDGVINLKDAVKILLWLYI